MAEATHFSSTTCEPSNKRLASGHICGKTNGAPMPDTKLDWYETSTGFPADKELVIGVAVATSTASTRAPGLLALIEAAIPQLKPPPPNGTNTVSTSGKSSRISNPIVPFPAITDSSANG